MKKLTKITALVLALALVLGMTTFAGTPVEILLTDDFSDFTNLAWDSFDTATRAKVAAATTIKEKATFTKTGTINKYFYNLNANLVSVNGKTAIQDTTLLTANGTTLAYLLPNGAYTLADNKDGKYAIVASIDYKPIQVGTVSTYGHDGFLGALMDVTNKGDGTVTYDNTFKTYLGFRNGVNNDDGTGSITVIGGNLDGVGNTETGIGKINKGEVGTITQVVRPMWSLYSEGTVTAEDNKSLQILKYVDGRVTTASGRPATVTTATNYITAVEGFFYTSPTKMQSEWSNFRMYKLSLDPEEFLCETESMTNVAIEDSIEMVYNQPLAISRFNSHSSDWYNDVRITPSGSDEPLVLGEDFTVDCVTDYIENGVAKGKIIITPLNGWEFDKTYTISHGSLPVTAARIAMTTDNNKIITFTTEKAPTFNVELKAYAGLTTGTELPALAKGTTYFAVSAAYSEGKVVANGTLRLEIKDANGNTVKSVTAKKALGTGTATFGAAFKLEAGMTATASIDGGIVGEATID